ncbi:MAG: DUF2905 domain-containing protein [Candidatus Omnitrophica bacterium]|nr:DUF2905 domain-containing protein [Candidatus Omnitrophota bacterium]MBU1090644.1 DUF2905 domain-containing protein [Candidatus Omnitrophota bacterium]
MQGFAKTVIIFGFILIVIGVLLSFFNKLSFFGRLPGDIIIERKNFTFYFPVVTSLMLSLILSLIFWLCSRR